MKAKHCFDSEDREAGQIIQRAIGSLGFYVEDKKAVEGILIKLSNEKIRDGLLANLKRSREVG